MSGSARCKQCGRPIVWATTTTRGKRMALDPDPSERGEFVLHAVGVDNGRVQFAVRHRQPGDPLRDRRTCHFDTCPGRRQRHERAAASGDDE